MKSNFSFLNLNSNDKLSSLNKNDIAILIEELLNFKLKLRGKLDIDSHITFGLELEFENIRTQIDAFENEFNKLNLSKGKIYDKIHDSDLWILKEDKSLSEVNGREIITPIFTDEFYVWKDLVKVCSFIKKYANIGTSSAGHIHIGSQILENRKESLLNLLKLWGIYENILCRFGYNEYNNVFPNRKYFKTSSEEFLNLYDISVRNNYDIEKILQSLIGRIKAISFSTTTMVSDHNKIAFKDTLEFRTPNATLNPIIWQNNLNTFVKLLKYTANSSFDMDIVNKRQILNKKLINPYNYNEIPIEEVLEFIDLIFDNNLDKIYFLRQYIKDNTSSDKLIRCKKFTL